jgi:hypothetical protein
LATFTENLQWPQWVVNGDSRQSEARFCFQAISGTYAASNISDDLFSVRPRVCENSPPDII